MSPIRSVSVRAMQSESGWVVLIDDARGREKARLVAPDLTVALEMAVPMARRLMLAGDPPATTEAT